MMSFFSKIWFPAALVSAVTLQMGVSHLMEKTLKKRIPEGDSNGKQE